MSQRRKTYPGTQPKSGFAGSSFSGPAPGWVQKRCLRRSRRVMFQRGKSLWIHHRAFCRRRLFSIDSQVLFQWCYRVGAEDAVPRALEACDVPEGEDLAGCTTEHSDAADAETTSSYLSQLFTALTDNATVAGRHHSNPQVWMQHRCGCSTHPRP